MAKRRNAQKIGRRNGNGKRNGKRFVPEQPDVTEEIELSEESSLRFGLWDESELWSIVGIGTDESDPEGIRRSLPVGALIPCVAALVSGAEAFLQSDSITLPKNTRSKLEQFVVDMGEAGYAEAA